MSIIKNGGKNSKQKKVINNLEKFYISREEVINFFLKIMEKWLLMQPADQNKMKLKKKGLKY